MTAAPFLDWCGRHYSTPEDLLAAFFPSAQAAAAQVGARLDELPKLDGRRHYLPALNGRRDQKQFYIASLTEDRDGTVWPAITFKSFRHGGQTLFWKPRDEAWGQFSRDPGLGEANDNQPQVEAYRAAVEATRQAQAAQAAARDRQQEDGHRAAAEAARAAWEQAIPSEDHPYLTRKRIAVPGLRVARIDCRAQLWGGAERGWRDVPAVRAGDLLVPMHDEAGRLVNLQRIDAGGRKRFILGGRAHGCHFEIPGGSGRRVLVEGLATGATWHRGSGDTVIVAFSAGALPLVASYARADLVAADNDTSGTGEKAARETGLPVLMPWQIGQDWNDAGWEAVRAAIVNANAEAFTSPRSLPAVALEGREATWWGKLAAAESAGDVAALAWAIARRGCVMQPPQQFLQTEHMRTTGRHPAGLLHPDSLRAIGEDRRKRLEQRKQCALSAVAISPDVMGRHDVETVATLPSLSAADYHGVILLNAPMGSGKTQRIGAPFAAWAKQQPGRFVAICHRQSLVDELALRLGCRHYQDVPADLAPSVEALATCLPSIVKADHAPILGKVRFVFLDEIAQVLRSLASKVTVADGKSPADVFHALRDLVRKAECVIGADAGMDDRVIAFLEACRPGERFRIIHLPHRNEGLAVKFGFGQDAQVTAYGEAQARLSAGERLWVGCGEKSRAIEVARVLEAGGARVLLLHGDNRNNPEQAKFWQDPEGVSRTYDAVVHTGVISSGLSIEHRETGPYFSHGLLFANGATITPADAMQMLRRVRYLRSWTIVVLANNRRDIDHAAAITAGMEEAAAREGLAVTHASDFDHFVATVEADHATQRADFAAGLWWGLEHQGFRVERLPLVVDEALGAEVKAVRAAIREQGRSAILAAPDLSDAEAALLRDIPRPTEAERLALLRHRIKTDLGVDDVDEAALEVWDEGRGPRRMDRFSAGVLGLADPRDPASGDLALHRFERARVLAYRALLAGVTVRSGLRITPEMATHLLGRVIERRYLLAYLAIVPAKWARYVGVDRNGQPGALPMPAYPLRDVREIFERMGLECRRRRNQHKAAVGATSPDICLEDIPPSGTQRRAIVATETWHEITAESWNRIARQAASRNRCRPVEGVG